MQVAFLEAVDYCIYHCLVPFLESFALSLVASQVQEDATIICEHHTQVRGLNYLEVRGIRLWIL
jgi:hypothetical protein